MCKFASFVLTKDREFWLPDNDSHLAIIENFGLHDDGVYGPNIIKVEISPSARITRFNDFKNWDLHFDQDLFPDWHDKEESAKRVFAALKRRAKEGFLYVDASGCTALTELKADAAKNVYASGCTALTELKADAAEYVDASGCTALTELKADAAEYVDARGCTALKDRRKNFKR